MDKMYKTKSSFDVKQRNMGKLLISTFQEFSASIKKIEFRGKTGY